VTLDRSIRPHCNIGPDEIARRRRSSIAFTALAAVVAVALVAGHMGPLARLAIFPFAAGAAVNWLQVVHRFCVAFGALGVENFGRLGQEHRVDGVQRASDRRRAMQLILEGSMIGLAVAVALAILPV
jgi:hypothetical protein